MTPAKTKSKTVKKKPTHKPAPKKKPAAKKAPAKSAAKPDKKTPAKAEVKAAKPDAKKPAAAKAAPASARDAAHPAAARFHPQETRAKKAPKVRPSRAREPGKRPDLPLPTPVVRPTGPAGAFGEKYVCFSCGAKFYDLGKPEPRCPKCGADQREAPRQPRVRPTPASNEAEPVERPVKRSRLLDEDEDEIVIDTDADAEPADDLDLGLAVVDDVEDFGTDEPEEEEVVEEET
jgi:hypothetical protein